MKFQLILSLIAIALAAFGLYCFFFKEEAIITGIVSMFTSTQFSLLSSMTSLRNRIKELEDKSQDGGMGRR